MIKNSPVLTVTDSSFIFQTVFFKQMTTKRPCSHTRSTYYEEISDQVLMLPLITTSAEPSPPWGMTPDSMAIDEPPRDARSSDFGTLSHQTTHRPMSPIGNLPRTGHYLFDLFTTQELSLTGTRQVSLLPLDYLAEMPEFRSFLCRILKPGIWSPEDLQCAGKLEKLISEEILRDY